eukprot:scaffold42806_cov237-Amphora_coffeaeformis.AAC.8
MDRRPGCTLLSILSVLGPRSFDNFPSHGSRKGSAFLARKEKLRQSLDELNCSQDDGVSTLDNLSRRILFDLLPYSLAD